MLIRKRQGGSERKAGPEKVMQMIKTKPLSLKIMPTGNWSKCCPGIRDRPWQVCNQ